MKKKLVTAALTAMTAIAGSASLSMPVFADAYGNYEVYNPATGEVYFINIYDYPGETIDTFIAKYGFELVVNEDEVAFKATHPDAHYASNGYIDDVVESTTPAFGDSGTTAAAASAAAASQAAVSTETTIDASAAAADTTTTAASTAETTQAATTASATSDTASAAKTTTAASNTAATASANHGPFDGITDEATKAFIGFTSDGVADSCYIDVYADSDNLVMPASAINYTKANKEDGSVNVVDKDGNTVISFEFPQVEIEEDVNLAYTLSNEDGIYSLSFEDEQDLGCNVIITIPVSDKNTDYYIYDKDGNEFFTVASDDSGYASFAVQSLQQYQLSKDVIEKTEEAAEADTEDEEEFPVSEELADESDTEEAQEADTEEADTQMPDEAEAPAESSNSALAAVPVVIVVAIAAIVGAWFFIFKKK